jgi:hypothetical protein
MVHTRQNRAKVGPQTLACMKPLPYSVLRSAGMWGIRTRKAVHV